MASKKTFIKYTFGVILYFCLCIFCVILKNTHSVSNYIYSKNYTSIGKCNLVHKHNELAKRNVDQFAAVKTELEYDAMRGEMTDIQKVPYLQTISEMCSHNNLSTVLVKRHYLYSQKNTSLYCWIRKIASTSFTKLFSDMRNRKVSNDYYKEIDILSPKTDEELKWFINDNQVFKFLVVRHPFERIVSSYRDRLEDNTKYTAQAWIYAPKIFHLTRPNLFRTNAKTGNSLSRIFHTDRRLKLIPTFKEFITWLLNEPITNDDVHWNSYYSHCSVCDIKYDYVMKLENYSFSDIDLIFSKSGLEKDEMYMPRLEETIGGFTDYQRTCSYFKALTRDMIFKLYQRYKIDFQMFDYKHENYLECVK